MYTPLGGLHGDWGIQTAISCEPRGARVPRGPLWVSLLHQGSPGVCDDLERASEPASRSKETVMYMEAAFPIGDEIVLHWVSAGTEGKEVLLYLAALAFLWTPWSLSQHDKNVCKPL